MKPFLSLVLLAAAITLSSCEQEISVPPRAEDTDREEIEGSMTATMGTDSFIAVSNAAVLTDSGFYIAGVDASGLKVEFRVTRTTQGAAQLNGMTGEVSVTPPGGESFVSSVGISSGELRILKIDTLKEIVKGTFSFVAKRKSDGLEKAFTSGRFEMNYTPMFPEEPIDTISRGKVTGSFAVKIDGAAYTPDSLSRGIAPDGLVTFNAYKGFAETFLVTFDTETDTGTYPLNSTSDHKIHYVSSATLFMPDSGSIKVVINDTAAKHFKANFNFKSGTKNFTEGLIDVKY